MEKRTAKAIANGELPKDFIVRPRGASVKDAFLLFLSAFLIVASILYVKDKVIAIAIILVVFGIINVYISMDINRQKELLKMTEFQSALFASALSMNYNFSFIVELKKHSVFYFDNSFQKVFPEFHQQDDRTLTRFFELNKTSEENQKTIHSLLDQKNEQNLVVDMEVVGKIRKIAVSIEPIQRPSGFVLIRGRLL